METAAFIASVVSIGIAAFAVWLAITFYKMATKVSEGIKDAAKDISSGVDRLEKLFDKLYADTFGMMRDTFTDMRKHIWSGEKVTEGEVSKEAEKKAEEKVGKLRTEFQDQIKETLSKQKITNKKYEALSKDMSKLMEKVIADSRKVDSEARGETLRGRLLGYLKQHPYASEGIRAEEVVGDIKKYRFTFGDILKELGRLRDEGIIEWTEKEMEPFSIIRLIK